MQIKSWISPKVVIRNSVISGKGMFAIKKIKAKEKVIIWNDKYINKSTAMKLKEKGKLVMQWDTNKFTAEDKGDDEGYFLNHSCDPNLWMQGIKTLVAIRDIKAGEEITSDYALWEGDENKTSDWVCKCGSKNCRTHYTGKDWKNKELQNKYFPHFSPLINKKIKKIRKKSQKQKQ